MGLGLAGRGLGWDAGAGAGVGGAGVVDVDGEGATVADDELGWSGDVNTAVEYDAAAGLGSGGGDGASSGSTSHSTKVTRCGRRTSHFRGGCSPSGGAGLLMFSVTVLSGKQEV